MKNFKLPICPSSVAAATANSIDILKRQSYYGWSEYTVGILDCRKIVVMPLESFSDEEIKIIEQEIEECNNE